MTMNEEWPDKERLANRYQNQPWYIKLWRRRWYLPIPYRAVRIYLRTSRDDMSWRNCWGLAKGLAQGPMEWWYTMDEVRDYLGDKNFGR